MTLQQVQGYTKSRKEVALDKSHLVQDGQAMIQQLGYMPWVA